jgi:peptidoglycan/LPS O-acetylase OafA/YrhL
MYRKQRRMNSSARYNGLDLLRVFSSFGVVFLHVYVSSGSPGSLDWFSKFRDFALPLMVMSSFFVLTISLRRKPEINFRNYFKRRLQRLWLPLVIWTFIYSLIVAYFVPVLVGAEGYGELPSAIVLFTGYRHLWFLQFIFVGSLLCYPLVYWFTEERSTPQIKLSLFCFCITFLYGFLFYSFLKNFTDWDSFSAEADINLRLFVSQVSNYILYIPLAVGIGLMSGRINDLFAQTRFRFVSLVLVLITMIIHVCSSGIPLTREIYSIAVFLAALQPWGQIPFKFWQTLASYSYGIYILHFLPAQILWVFVVYKNLELDGAQILGITVITYFASFAMAVLLRKLFSADWFLPLVAISAENRPQTIT